jgi:leader peptidase (prepilin peptidase)/N-methyltransferase
VTPLDWIVTVFVFVFGGAVGSFLNVCIYRLPRALSIQEPARSFCPACGHGIAWYDNLPVVSWLRLRGRCRHCGGRISWRYPLVELVTAVVFGVTWLKLRYVDGVGAGPGVLMLLLCALLIVAVATDFEFRIIPEEISFFGLAGGLLASALVPELHVGGMPWHTLESLTGVVWLDGLIGGLIGAVASGGLVTVAALAGYWLFKKEAMGGGDVRLMALVGSFLGWKIGLLAFFIAPFVGLVYGLAMLFSTGDHYMPYGPWLALATWVCMLARGPLTRYVDDYCGILRDLWRLVFGG